MQVSTLPPNPSVTEQLCLHKSARELLEHRNPKVLFLESFTIQSLPTLQLVSDMLTAEYCLTNQEPSNEFSRVLRDFTGLIGSNAFMAVCTALLKTDFTNVEIDFLSSVALLLCTRCGKKYSTEDFVCYSRRILYELCYSCGHSEQLPANDFKCMYSKIETLVGGRVVSRNDLKRITFNASKFLGVGFYYLHSITITVDQND